MELFFRVLFLHIFIRKRLPAALCLISSENVYAISNLKGCGFKNFSMKIL